MTKINNRREFLKQGVITGAGLALGWNCVYCFSYAQESESDGENSAPNKSGKIT